jgi:organic hydroperoxide reductase OsmC/OhrA
MSEHRARVAWERTTDDFEYDTYPRDHEWSFAEAHVAASSAPEFKGTASRVNPEEALVAALSSCHMLTFLAICARKRIAVDRYEDAAVGTLEKNEEGRLAMTKVVLRPRITFAGEAPSPEALGKLHESSHRNCFIANSVRTEVTVE